MTLDEVMARRVRHPDGCMSYPGSLSKGYAQARIDGRPQVIIRALVPAPPGTHRHHTCEHKWCVNEEHIEVVAPRDHSARHPQARRTHCKRGHPLTPDNVTAGKSGRGRCCRTCHRMAVNRHDRKRRAKA